MMQFSIFTIVLTIWVVIAKLHLIHQTIEVQNKLLAKLSGLKLDSDGEIVEEESEPSEEPTS